MNQVDVSREKVLQGFGAIGADHGIDVNQFLDEQEQITLEREEPALDIDEPSSQEILQAVGTDVFAEYFPGLAMRDDEIERLAKVYGPLIDKYFPGGILQFLEKFRLEIAAVTTTYIVFRPRYRAYKQSLANEAQPANSETHDQEDTDDGDEA